MRKAPGTYSDNGSHSTAPWAHKYRGGLAYKNGGSYKKLGGQSRHSEAQSHHSEAHTSTEHPLVLVLDEGRRIAAGLELRMPGAVI